MLNQWKKLEKILLVRLDTIGDVIMSTPAINSIRSSNPNAKIVLLTSKSGAETAKMLPAVDETIIFEAPWLKVNKTIPSKDVLHTAELLHRQNFSASIIFNVYSQSPLPSAMLCWLAGIPLRAAYSHENPYELLTNWFPDPEPQKFIRHETIRQLSLVGNLGFLALDENIKFKIPEEAKIRTRKLLNSLNVSCENLVILHPGATEEARRFKKEFFVDLGRKLSEKGLTILVTGSENEKELCEFVEKGIGKARSLSGRLKLEELTSLIESAKLIVTNNTAVSHLAAAFKTSEIVFYANTNPQHTPWRNPNAKVFYFSVPCKACSRGVCAGLHHEVKQEPSLEEVLKTASRLIHVKQFAGANL